LVVIAVIPATIPGIAPAVITPAVIPTVVAPTAVPGITPAARIEYSSASAVPKIFDGSHTNTGSQHRGDIIVHEISEAIAAASVTIVTAVIGIITIAINRAIATTIVTATGVEAASGLYIIAILALKLSLLHRSQISSFLRCKGSLVSGKTIGTASHITLLTAQINVLSMNNDWATVRTAAIEFNVAIAVIAVIASSIALAVDVSISHIDYWRQIRPMGLKVVHGAMVANSGFFPCHLGGFSNYYKAPPVL